MWQKQFATFLCTFGIVQTLNVYENVKKCE